MSNTNTKIWFLVLATGSLFWAGCATETAEQRDQRIKTTLQAFMIQAQSTEERISGKARKDWGPTEITAYNALVLEMIQYWHQAEQEGVARRQAQAAMIANGLQQAGDQIRQGAQQSGYGSGVILGSKRQDIDLFQEPGRRGHTWQRWVDHKRYRELALNEGVDVSQPFTWRCDSRLR